MSADLPMRFGTTTPHGSVSGVLASMLEVAVADFSRCAVADVLGSPLALAKEFSLSFSLSDGTLPERRRFADTF